MKQKIIALLMCCSLLVTSGCATMRSTSDSIADSLGTDKGTTQTATGATAGAVAGGLVGQLLGGNTTSTVIGALIGGALGGFFAYADAKDRGLFEAEKMVEKLKSEGIENPVIHSEVREEAITDDKGELKKNVVMLEQKNTTTAKPVYRANEVKKVAYFKGLSYPIPESSLLAKSKTLSSTLRETGAFALSRQPVEVVVEAKDDAAGKWMATELKKGFGKTKNSPKIIVTKGQKDKPAMIHVIVPAQQPLKA